jgi:hypothetical protein
MLTASNLEYGLLNLQKKLMTFRRNCVIMVLEVYTSVSMMCMKNHSLFDKLDRRSFE